MGRYIGIHGTKRRLYLHVHIVIFHIHDDRLSVTVTNQDHGTINVIHEITLI